MKSIIVNLNDAEARYQQIAAVRNALNGFAVIDVGSEDIRNVFYANPIEATIKPLCVLSIKGKCMTLMIKHQLMSSHLIIRSAGGYIYDIESPEKNYLTWHACYDKGARAVILPDIDSLIPETDDEEHITLLTQLEKFAGIYDPITRIPESDREKIITAATYQNTHVAGHIDIY